MHSSYVFPGYGHPTGVHPFLHGPTDANHVGHTIILLYEYVLTGSNSCQKP